MKYTQTVLRIIIAAACTNGTMVHCTELTVFAYVKRHAQKARELLVKMIVSLNDSEKTVAHIKDKIFDYNMRNNNCLGLSSSMTAEQLPDIRHMSRTQSPVTADEIKEFKHGAAVSIILQES